MTDIERPDVLGATRRAETIRSGMVGYAAAMEAIGEAFEARDWVALGHKNWDDYCEKEFSEKRLKLTQQQREQAVLAFRHAGMSIRAIGSALGLPKSSVADTLTQVSEPGHLPAETKGADGKTYSSTKTAADAETPPADGADDTTGAAPAGDGGASPTAVSGNPPSSPGGEATDSAGAGAHHPGCENCAAELDDVQAHDGFVRCADCDPDGDHVLRDGACSVCHPEDSPADRDLVDSPESAAVATTGRSEANQPAAVPVDEVPTDAPLGTDAQPPKGTGVPPTGDESAAGGASPSAAGAPETEEEQAAREVLEFRQRVSRDLSAGLVAIKMRLEPDPIRWLEEVYVPGQYSARDLPRVRDCFTAEGLRASSAYLAQLADYVAEHEGAL